MLIPVSIVIPIYKDGEDVFLWMQRREEQGHLNQKWEFPGGKWEENELPEDCAIRELEEETGVKADKVEFLRAYPFEYKDRSVSLFAHIFYCEKETFKSGSWFHLNEVNLNDIPEANIEMIADLKKYFN